MLAFVMWASAARDDCPAFFAVERMLELDDFNADFLGCETREDFLGIVCAVICANPSVVASDNKMGATIVFAADGVQYRFSRSGIAHCGGVCTEQHAVARIVILEQHFISTHAGCHGNIIGFGFANQWI